MEGEMLDSGNSSGRPLTPTLPPSTGGGRKRERGRRRKFYRQSFAQEGEDMILASVFEGKKTGFFVDVGAHHPKRFSNTYYFYCRGWRGINIEATPGGMRGFRISRREDVNVEAAVSDVKETLEFFVFNEGALNTFDPKLAAERDGLASYRIEKKVAIETRTLKEILGEHLPEGKEIDFLTVDVEGMDLAVLRSNDWEKYRPVVVLAEDNGAGSWQRIGESATSNYLRQWGYEPFASTFRTIFYRRGL